MKWEPIEGEKQCAACREVKELSAFSVLASGKFGRHAYCKSCRSMQNKKRQRVTARKKPQRNPTEWLMPEMTLTQSLDCIRLRKWRYPVEPANNLTWTIAA